VRCLAVLALAACGSSQPVVMTSLASAPAALPVAPQEPRALRVMSYNVNFGLAGDPEGAAAITAAAPDIVLLQETDPGWEVALVDTLGGTYPHHRFEPPPDWPAGGMGILSKYPIVSADILPSTAGPFFAWRLVVDSPLGRIQLLDVHLKPPMSDSGSWVVGFFSTRDNRLSEAMQHAQSLDPSLPTIIAGDFNEESSGRALAYFDEQGYVDATAQFAGTRRTWEWPVGSITLRFQLDHILYDTRLIAIAGGIVERGRSDHKPIWADFVSP
jgi:endonuclease/exonuclease/phosphatase (EEP) superfamily protein YafD